MNKFIVFFCVIFFCVMMESYDRAYYYRKSIFFPKKNRKGFKIVTDDYVLTLDDALLNYLFEVRKI